MAIRGFKIQNGDLVLDESGYFITVSSADKIKRDLHKRLSTDSYWGDNDTTFFRYNKDKPFRINYPGSANDSNWRCVIPFNIEMLDILSINKTIWDINRETDRI